MSESFILIYKTLFICTNNFYIYFIRNFHFVGAILFQIYIYIYVYIYIFISKEFLGQGK